MMRVAIIFIPAPIVGHMVSAVEVAKLLVRRYEQISITILIMKHPFDSDGIDAFLQNQKKDAPERIAFVDVPALDEAVATELRSKPLMSVFTSFIERQTTQVRDVVAAIMNQSDKSKIVGFVIDMFCTPMIDVANEFNVPSYVFFTSGAAFLGFVLYCQSLKDNENLDICDYKDSDAELSVSSFTNPVPVKVLPTVMFTKDGSANTTIMARKIRETKGILVNTVLELEAHAIKSLVADKSIPLIYHVGPIIKLVNNNGSSQNQECDDDISRWLDSQPPSSVVFLCFGSMGGFNAEQVREIARALELSGHRFLWSLRRASQEQVKLVESEDYKDYNEVLPEGFLERTSGIGKVIGWAPQVTILSHPSVGGFVSHCGWNSTLESIWCGVPIAAWPMYAEQQLNAFLLVMELGLATEIKVDYRKENVEILKAEEIVRGIKSMVDEESMVRKKMKEMKDVCRNATAEGGSSYISLGQFIQDLMDNNSIISDEALNSSSDYSLHKTLV